MKIMIVAHFCEDFSKNDNGRFCYLANMLSCEHDVEIVTSDFEHMTKTPNKTIDVSKVPFKVTLIHESGYRRNVCLKRFVSHYEFGRRLIKYIKSVEKPDVIYCAVPSLSGPNLVSKYCKKNGIKFIIDVQDLWPEAYKMVFNIPIISDIIFLPFTILANGIYKRADKICAVSNTYVERAKKVNKNALAKSVFLGTKLETFDNNLKSKSHINRTSEDFIIGYCGTLGNSYDINCVIDAISKLNYKIRFVVMGTGPLENEFKVHAKKMNVNVEFLGFVPYDEMCATLSNCDIVVNPITKGAAGSIINKHADYAAVGLPVINTQECQEYRNLVDEYKMGYNTINSDSVDMAKKIEELYLNKELRLEMGRSARKCAEELFDRNKTYIELVNAILD